MISQNSRLIKYYLHGNGICTERVDGKLTLILSLTKLKPTTSHTPFMYNVFFPFKCERNHFVKTLKANKNHRFEVLIPFQIP